MVDLCLDLTGDIVAGIVSLPLLRRGKQQH
jgi:hypothetical protein